MPFQKGKPKTGGIKKGQTQAKTKAWERMGELMMGRFTEDVIDQWRDLKPEQRTDLYLKLLSYFKPQLQRSESKTELSFKDGLKIGYGDRGAEAGD